MWKNDAKRGKLKRVFSSIYMSTYGKYITWANYIAAMNFNKFVFNIYLGKYITYINYTYFINIYNNTLEYCLIILNIFNIMSSNIKKNIFNIIILTTPNIVRIIVIFLNIL